MSAPSEQINTILLVASVTSPVLFGFVLWKLSRIFTTKEEHQAHDQRISKIENHVTDIRLDIKGLQSKGNDAD